MAILTSKLDGYLPNDPPYTKYENITPNNYRII